MSTAQTGSAWSGLVNQFGRMIVPTDDPAWQPPSDPLLNEERTRDSARLIHREIPNVLVKSGWEPPAIRQAIESLVVGLFDLPTQLHESVAADSRVQSAMRSRAAGLLSRPVRFRLPRKYQNDPTAQKCLRKWRAHWRHMVAEPAILHLLESSTSLGFAYAQVLWDTSGSTWYPYLSAWNSRYSYYHWMLRAHVAVTMDGQVPITPGDAHWVLHAPYGQYRGWMYGALRPVAQWVLARDYALRDWARYTERHGFPIMLADTPFGADPASISNYQNQLTGMGQENILQLPGSVDTVKYGKYDLRLLETKDASWQAFQALIEQCNAEITLALLGQNLTSEIREGSMAAARVHADVLQTWLQADARALEQTLYRDVLRPFAALNFGNPDYAPILWWDVSPAEDATEMAKAVQAFGQGLNQMRLAGVKVKDPVAFAKAVGINIAGGTESVDPTQVAGKIAGTGDVGAAESAEDEKDTDAGTDSKASRVGTAAA